MLANLIYSTLAGINSAADGADGWGCSVPHVVYEMVADQKNLQVEWQWLVPEERSPWIRSGGQIRSHFQCIGAQP